MKRLLKSLVLRSLALANVFPARMTGTGEVGDLMRRLHPVSGARELVRLGPAGDGGYLVPDDLVGVGACFSPGVSCISGFELDCAERGMQVFLADRSVAELRESHDRFHFTRKYVGVTTNSDFMTVDDWVGAAGVDPAADLVLQMDIEGYEYEVLLAMSDALMRRFRIVVAEFHHLDQLWCRSFFSLASRALDKLLQTHACVHIHPNNCCGILEHQGLEIPRVAEFTFVRRDRIESPRFRTDFPHALDYDNTDNPHLVLPRCWYRQQTTGAGPEH